MTSLALGAVLGLVAGIVPGPFFTLVATTAVRDGLRAGLRVALVPLGTELPALIAAVFLLTRLPDEGLRWLGVAGGALLLYVAWRVASTGRKGAEGLDGSRRKRGSFVHAVAIGLVSPTPWAFWFLVGGPITVNRWHQDAALGLVFVATFLGCFVGSLAGIAWVASSTGRQLGVKGARRFFYGAGTVLAVAGLLLAWQSWIGNFAALVQAPERIEEGFDRTFR